jgi:hypothetical protein
MKITIFGVLRIVRFWGRLLPLTTLLRNWPLWVSSSHSAVYHLGGWYRPEAVIQMRQKKPRHEGGAIKRLESID